MCTCRLKHHRRRDSVVKPGRDCRPDESRLSEREVVLLTQLLFSPSIRNQGSERSESETHVHGRALQVKGALVLSMETHIKT